MATWAHVERDGLGAPETHLGDSHGGEPVVLQFRVPEEDLVSAC